MTNQNEGIDSPDGADGSSSPNVSGEESKSFYGSQEQLRELLRAEIKNTLEPTLKELRGLQGKQDKTDKALREFQDEFAKQVKAGATPDEAYQAASAVQDNENRARKREELIDQLLSDKFGAGKSADTDKQPAIDKAKTLIEKYGLDANDAEIAQLVSTSPEAEWEGKLAIRAYNKTPSLAGAMSMQGKPSGQKLSENEADNKYAEIGRLLYDPTTNAKKIASLTKELTDGGFEV